MLLALPRLYPKILRRIFGCCLYTYYFIGASNKHSLTTEYITTVHKDRVFFERSSKVPSALLNVLYVYFHAVCLFP